MQIGKIDQKEAFVQIKAEFDNSDDYNDAEVKIRVGNRYKTIKWNEFESTMGAVSYTHLDVYKRQGVPCVELTAL